MMYETAWTLFWASVALLNGGWIAAALYHGPTQQRPADVIDLAEYRRERGR